MALRKLEKNLSVAHVFWLVFVYMSMWLYTEVHEYIERDDFFNEVDEFIHAGDRFTKEDGDALEERVRELEERCCG